MSWKLIAIWSAVAVTIVAVILVFVFRSQRWRPRAVSVQGAVVRDDGDPRNQLPISNVRITATDGVMTNITESDASGYFHIKFNENMWPGQTLMLSFQKDDYKPLELSLPLNRNVTTRKLYVAALTPIQPNTTPAAEKKQSVLADVRIRYTVNSQGDENIASATKTFTIENTPNVPCNRQGPCSPDGNWKAAVGSATLDAGPGNEFRNVRASCIAGPCPFTRIDSSGFQHGGRIITANALDWSGTATFLLEAEVFRKSITSSVRESYPVIFGRTLNFVLPGSQEGASIEAELDGTPMVFPLGPELYLSWATCTARASLDNASSTVFRCELKPGYRF
ncbi:MAG TPA: hypothetical protein VKB38_12540 [Terracidiphilus sp.]|nr:hypothetical protein [Terracidiphilus sp.]